MKHRPASQIRTLTLALILSGTLNIASLALVFYWYAREQPPTPYFELKPAKTLEQQTIQAGPALSHLIHRYKGLSFEALKAELTNTQPVDQGFSKREIALACLTAFHYFDLERALAHPSLLNKKRIFAAYQATPETQAGLSLYAGLTDKQFREIFSFLKTERWPFKSKGLFLLLQKQSKEARDATLIDAFFMTQEFLSAELLFARADLPVDREELLNMLLEGSWKQLSSFTEQQRIAQDLSAEKRKQFLLSYAENGSHTAKQYLEREQPKPVASKQSMELGEKKASSVPTVQKKSPPPPETSLTAMPVPEPEKKKSIQVQAAPKPRQQPLPDKKPLISSIPHKLPSSLKKQEHTYIVQEGDSLWKISKKFNVNIDRLRAYNQLDSDALKPGKSLRIPS